MATERRWLFPLNDNDGVPLDKENAAIRKQILRIQKDEGDYPGYTEIDATGVWQGDTGGVSRDQHKMLMVLSDKPRVHQRLSAQHNKWRDTLRQEALYEDSREINSNIS